MVIAVTADDIRKGKRGSPKDCPVALALSREGIILTLVQFAYLPCMRTVFRFMCDFDMGRKVEPFEFELP